MLTHPHIASQLAAQHQRDILVQASKQRLRRQLRAQAARLPATATDRSYQSWRVRARTVLRRLAHRLTMRRPAI
jgi:hypothetical protein